MLKLHLSLFVVLFYLAAFSQQIIRLNNQPLSSDSLDRKITELMRAAKVHGLGVTVFNNNQPVYKKTFGYKSLEKKQPIKGTTNIYGALLSKPVFATMVLKLVEQGILDLDKPLQSYLPKPIYEYTPQTKWHDDYSDLRTDTLYQKITARMCLDYSSGFPNWRWYTSDQKLKVIYEPGTKYLYSGEGLVYLQVVLERMLNKSLEQLMQENVFFPLGMRHTSFKWQPAFEADYCVGHNPDGKAYEKDKDNEPRGPSTMETTLDDYTIFTQAILTNKLLKPATRKAMFTPQIRIRSIMQFGPLSLRDSTANDDIELSYGLGWGLLKSPYGTGAFKEGHGDGFQHYSIIFPDTGTGIIIMSNSDNAESIFKYLLEHAIGDVYTPWRWENYFPYDFRF